MSEASSFLFNRGQSIQDNYKVLFPLKKGYYAESYRVEDKNKRVLFLKLLDPSKLHTSQVTREGEIIEIQFIERFSHPNVVSYEDHGELILGNRKYVFLVLGFISGETVAEKLVRETTIPEYAVKSIMKGVLNGLQYMHGLEDPIIHNDITHHNVMLDLSEKPFIPTIIDFGYARSFLASSTSYYSSGLNPFYMANECYNHLYSPLSDLFSAGALLYHMIFGIPPWFTEIAPYKTSEQIKEDVLRERKKPLSFPMALLNNIQASDSLLSIIHKALSPDLDDRFKTAEDFSIALEDSSFHSTLSQKPPHGQLKSKSANTHSVTNKKKGRGFADVAGLDDLKDILKNDVIEAMKEPDKYEEFGLTIPNGLLLYGPPGCGKTFIAEKLAEEIAFNFLFIKPSDLGSIYIHGSQEKISKLFNEARENAPSIIFMDELDALMPDRSEINHQSISSEVNEFLTQMTNCSKDGVMIIGATNRPEKIDKAILRTGRMDRIVFVPPPDSSAREKIFEMELKNRPTESNIDYSLLSEYSEGFVASDIVFVVDEAARFALRNDKKIEQNVLINKISETRPSVNSEQLKAYEMVKNEMEGKEGTGKRIGF